MVIASTNFCALATPCCTRSATRGKPDQNTTAVCEMNCNAYPCHAVSDITYLALQSKASGNWHAAHHSAPHMLDMISLVSLFETTACGRARHQQCRSQRCDSGVIDLLTPDPCLRLQHGTDERQHRYTPVESELLGRRMLAAAG